MLFHDACRFQFSEQVPEHHRNCFFGGEMAFLGPLLSWVHQLKYSLNACTS